MPDRKVRMHFTDGELFAIEDALGYYLMAYPGTEADGASPEEQLNYQTIQAVVARLEALSVA